MGFFELFSRRNAPKPEVDVYTYDKIPEKLRVQIIHILNETFDSHSASHVFWNMFVKGIKKEFGLLKLDGYSHQKCIENFLLTSNDRDVIDAIDLIFYHIDQLLRLAESRNFNTDEDRLLINRMKSAIEELNYRFKQHNVGYEFINGELIQINNQLVHRDIVRPAIQLLFEEGFETASDEFLEAHEHYRKGEYEEAITDAERAFESTMKIICHKKGYEYDEKAPAKKLINTLLQNEFIPQYLQNHFNHLCNTLECGLPTIRNRNGSHGQGVKQIEIPEYMAKFAINLCASNIVFLVDIYKSNLG